MFGALPACPLLVSALAIGNGDSWWEGDSLLICRNREPAVPVRLFNAGKSEGHLRR